MISFSNNIFILGYGGVSKCFLPLLFKHLDINPSQVTIMDFVDKSTSLAPYVKKGLRYIKDRVTESNYIKILETNLKPGDFFIDLSWNVETSLLLDWCHKHDVLYVNTSVEEWDPYSNVYTCDPRELTLHKRQIVLKKLKESWFNKKGATAIIDHGANPGLVSHFVKQGLIDISEKVLASNRIKGPREKLLQELVRKRSFPQIAQLLGLKAVHISERDTQITNKPKEVNEFVNTWSIPGLIEEGLAPAEIGWGSHEKELPFGAMLLEDHKRGNQICLSTRGMNTWVRSWVPSGPIVGLVIRHGECYGISHHLTVWEGDEPVYRPTVNYAYCLCDAGIASLHEFEMRRMVLQDSQRLLMDDIIKGNDELGCLLMGHDLGAWWIGSVLSIEESRKLVPGQNATTVQVAIGVIGAVIYAIRHPNEGLCLPDDLNYEEILTIAKPYLGSFISMQADWSPLDKIKDVLDFNVEAPSVEDEWQFTTFLTSPQLRSSSFLLH